METIGKYQNRKVIWLDDHMNDMPKSNWVCMLISNVQPNKSLFDKFVRKAIKNEILEFKSCGMYGQFLHDFFDTTIVEMEINEGHDNINICTTWHNDESVADVFWQCFFATALPETTDYDNITIACYSFDNDNYCDDLKSYIKKFEKGWIPE